MTHVITSACIESMDQSCTEVCPVECIYEAERMLAIHPEECIDCGACIPECPVEAIFTEQEVPPHERRIIEVNAAMAHGVEAVNAAVAALLASPTPPTPSTPKGSD